jgi:hypothetical protein
MVGFNRSLSLTFCHLTQKVTKKSWFTDASPRLNKMQEYKRKMGEKMRLTPPSYLSLIFSNFPFSQQRAFSLGSFFYEKKEPCTCRYKLLMTLEDIPIIHQKSTGYIHKLT